MKMFTATMTIDDVIVDKHYHVDKNLVVFNDAWPKQQAACPAHFRYLMNDGISKNLSTSLAYKQI